MFIDYNKNAGVLLAASLVRISCHILKKIRWVYSLHWALKNK